MSFVDTLGCHLIVLFSTHFQEPGFFLNRDFPVATHVSETDGASTNFSCFVKELEIEQRECNKIVYKKRL